MRKELGDGSRVSAGAQARVARVADADARLGASRLAIESSRSDLWTHDLAVLEQSCDTDMKDAVTR